MVISTFLAYARHDYSKLLLCLFLIKSQPTLFKQNFQESITGNQIFTYLFDDAEILLWPHYIAKFKMSKIPLGNSMINESQINKKGSSGILLKKDLHLAELQAANRQLRQQLSNEMDRFQTLSRQESIVSSREKQLQTLINLASIEGLFSSKQIEKINKQKLSISLVLNQLKEKTLNADAQVEQLTEKIQALFTNSSEAEKQIKRYRQQLRNDELLLKSQKNLTNIRKNLSNSYQNYEKHISILEQKLESKHRYLKILERKIKAQGKTMKFSSKKIENQVVGNIISQRLPKTIKANRQKQQQKFGKIEKDDRDEIKKMNELIRKKNSVLLKKK